ncbi:hypothetical protein [Streptomyces sp. NPDC059816]|uniref:hypothetical protein n=1 Tax=Streptomyces sp. NPDC059816 TaxID=3346960 RepID=UPI00366A1EEF
MTSGQQHTSKSATLPKGWTSFASRPDSQNATHWYATSPYPVGVLKREYGEAAAGLCHTVDAATLPELRAQVAAQVDVFRWLTGEGDE